MENNIEFKPNCYVLRGVHPYTTYIPAEVIRETESTVTVRANKGIERTFSGKCGSEFPLFENGMKYSGYLLSFNVAYCEQCAERRERCVELSPRFQAALDAINQHVKNISLYHSNNPEKLIDNLEKIVCMF